MLHTKATSLLPPRFLFGLLIIFYLFCATEKGLVNLLEKSQTKRVKGFLTLNRRVLTLKNECLQLFFKLKFKSKKVLYQIVKQFVCNFYISPQNCFCKYTIVKKYRLIKLIIAHQRLIFYQ